MSTAGGYPQRPQANRLPALLNPLIVLKLELNRAHLGYAYAIEIAGRQVMSDAARYPSTGRRGRNAGRRPKV